jgi:hypothetical protein
LTILSTPTEIERKPTIGGKMSSPAPSTETDLLQRP